MLNDLMDQVVAVARKTEPHTFIDVCGGSGTCAMNARLSGYVFPNVKYNEKDINVYLIMMAAQEPDVARKIYSNLHQIERTGGVDEALYDAARARLSMDDISLSERVYQASIVAWCSFNSKWNTISKSRASHFEAYAARYLDAWMYLRNVDILNEDAFDILDKYGADPKVLKYIDPPYFPLTRNKTAQRVYKYDWTREDHQRLVRKLVNCRCWILSGYDPAEQGYDDYLPLEEAGAKKVLLKRVALPSSNTIAGKESTKKNEYIWIKY